MVVAKMQINEIKLKSRSDGADEVRKSSYHKCKIERLICSNEKQKM